MMTLKKWAEENGYYELYNEYVEACDQIAEECEAEGYPSHGSNYELRVEALQASYPELFGDDEEA